MITMSYNSYCSTVLSKFPEVRYSRADIDPLRFRNTDASMQTLGENQNVRLKKGSLICLMKVQAAHPNSAKQSVPMPWFN